MDLEVEDNEDYEIISKKDIAKLKDEIRSFKQGSAPSESTVLSRLNQMLDMFKEASISMKTGPTTAEILDQINEKLTKILEQNQQIAEGIIALADLAKEPEKEEKKIESIEEKLKPKPLMPEIPKFQEAEPMFAQQFNQQAPEFMQPEPEFMQQTTTPPRPISFPKPQMPSLNPMEDVEHKGFSDIPPLPPRPPKKGFFKF